MPVFQAVDYCSQDTRLESSVVDRHEGGVAAVHLEKVAKDGSFREGAS
jgi:hypothetical protein